MARGRSIGSEAYYAYADARINQAKEAGEKPPTPTQLYTEIKDMGFGVRKTTGLAIVRVALANNGYPVREITPEMVMKYTPKKYRRVRERGAELEEIERLIDSPPVTGLDQDEIEAYWTDLLERIAEDHTSGALSDADYATFSERILDRLAEGI